MLAKLKVKTENGAGGVYADLWSWKIPVRMAKSDDDYHCVLIDQTNLTPLQQKNLELTYGVEWCKIGIDDVKLREEW